MQFLLVSLPFVCSVLIWPHLYLRKVFLSNRVSLVTMSLVCDVVNMANIGKPAKLFLNVSLVTRLYSLTGYHTFSIVRPLRK